MYPWGYEVFGEERGRRIGKRKGKRGTEVRGREREVSGKRKGKSASNQILSTAQCHTGRAFAWDEWGRSSFYGY